MKLYHAEQQYGPLIRPVPPLKPTNNAQVYPVPKVSRAGRTKGNA